MLLRVCDTPCCVQHHPASHTTALCHRGERPCMAGQVTHPIKCSRQAAVGAPLSFIPRRPRPVVGPGHLGSRKATGPPHPQQRKAQRSQHHLHRLCATAAAIAVAAATVGSVRCQLCCHGSQARLAVALQRGLQRARVAVVQGQQRLPSEPTQLLPASCMVWRGGGMAQDSASRGADRALMAFPGGRRGGQGR